MGTKKVRLLAVALVGLTACAFALPSSGEAAPKTGRLSPQLFSELSSGIALVRTFNCHGAAIDEGSGFLVGSSVVMTAGHVVWGACRNRVKVLLGGTWYGVAKANYWFTRGQRQDAATVDITTLLLTQPSDGHIFTISPSSATKGENLSALGHPLGNDISLNQGHVVLKLKHDHVKLLAVRMLNAEGGSGSPLVDDQGNVAGIVQQDLGGIDILGQLTGGVQVGIDLPAWSNGQFERALCNAYKDDGIPDCDGGILTPPPPAPPPPPSGPLGSRTNPWPIGTAATAGDWTLKVNSVNFDAWSVVGPVDTSNPKPPAGYVDVLVNLTATYNGSGSRTLTDLQRVILLRSGPDYLSSPDYESCGVAPHPNASDVAALAQAQTATANICTMPAAGETSALELTLPGAGGVDVWFALH